ncbi:hypothetical protein [Winogradskya humida]|uniref:hypothetical protein n=1 Tax=Winogradskya humida TaxID=113566 RepID=UPI001944FA29|nr:hypothetical protein [Actinoplanes humidus]
MWNEHEGEAVAAFQTWWAREDSPAKALLDGTKAATLTGTGLMICGGIVLTLKIAVIAQLACGPRCVSSARLRSVPAPIG